MDKIITTSDTIIAKSAFTWCFKQDDWFIDLLLNNAEIRHEIFILKNYSATKINKIVYDLSLLIKEQRTEMEKDNEAFIAKKKYLKINEDNENIQVSLEEEYRLKDLIEKFKIYSFISWVHLGKNSGIFKHCTIEKQKIINQIFPIIDLSIRKVIGSKVIDIRDKSNYDLFEEAVNHAWMAITKYLTRIDTSAVMFSILVGTAHKSAINFKNNHLAYVYNTIRTSDLSFINNSGSGDDDVSEDTFFNTVMNNNTETDDLVYNPEEEILEGLDSSLDLLNDIYYLYEDTDDIDEIIDSISRPGQSNCMQQNILAHCFDILSGKIKKICFEKIFAEFFFDLINSQISEKVIEKHSKILIEIMDLVVIDPNIVQDTKKNIEIYKLFRSWIKEKIADKMNKYNINKEGLNHSDIKKQQILDLIKRERVIMEYLKKNREKTLIKLLEFKNNCINFRNQ